MAGVTENRAGSETRRERSREAARYRRDKESEVFGQLARELPLPHRVSTQLDKASILRLTISFLRLRSLLATGDGEQRPGCPLGLSNDLVPMLDGFLLLLTQSGEVVFTGDNVGKHMGLTQWELMGQNIFDFTHPCDHGELQEALAFGQDVDNEEINRERDFIIRVKCTVTNQGKMVNLRSATWKVLHCRGLTRAAPGNGQAGPGGCLILICDPAAFPLSSEPAWEAQSFLTSHSLDMKFTYCDRRVQELIGFEVSQLLGQSVYHFIHPLDLKHIWKRHQSLLKTGQVTSGQYRMLLRFGGYIWVQTEATLVYERRSKWPMCVVCVNYILSSPEHRGIVFSVEQMEPCSELHPGGRQASFPVGAVLPGDTKRLRTKPPELSVALNGGIRGVQWCDTSRHIHRPIPSVVAEAGLWAQGLEDESSRIPGLTLGPHSSFSTSVGGVHTGGAFVDQDLDTLAPFIPMEDEDFQLAPIENQQKGASLGNQTLPQRGAQQPDRFSPDSVWDLSSQRRIKRSHQMDCPCDLAVCLCEDSPLTIEALGPLQQKRSKVLSGLSTDELCCPGEKPSLLAWSTDLPSCLWASSPDPRGLPILTPIDCEVNIPLHGARLLHGTELLGFLDQAILYRECEAGPTLAAGVTGRME